jgi:hypothetical protein
MGPANIGDIFTGDNSETVILKQRKKRPTGRFFTAELNKQRAVRSSALYAQPPHTATTSSTRS